MCSMASSLRKKRSTCFPAFIIAVLIIVSYPGPTFAQDQDKDDNYRLNKEFLNSLQHDFISVSTSPSKWQQKDLLTFAAVLGTGVFLYSVDPEIHHWSREQQNSSLERTASFFSAFGNGAFLGGLSAALYLSGELTDSQWLRKTALLSLESLGTSAVIVLSIKFITGRARPQSGKSRDTYRPFSTAANFSSFPSGHSSSAFAVATVIASESDILIIDVFSYFLASMVALSRVQNNKHWASDVFIGSSIGYFIGKKISSLHKDRKKGKLKVGWQWSPNSQGFTLSYSF